MFRAPSGSAALFLLLGSFLLIPDAFATAHPTSRSDEDDDQDKRVHAVRVDEPPVIDGIVLEDPVWQNASLIEGFWQTTPDEGEPATEYTEVRVLYDQESFYVSVVCHHQDPGQIIVSEATRDGDLQNIDSFQFVLDTFKDTQNGFVFGTSPAGIEYDAQISNEGGGQFGFSGAQSSSGGGLNLNWDGSWDVRSRIHDGGWSAEFAIPFKTLRFPSKPVQEWGINFQRNIRHNNEVVYWAPLPRQFNLYKVSLAGTLEGINVPDPRNLKIMPYVLGQRLVDRDAQRDPALANPDGRNGEFGADAKFSITPSLALDLTYNTDFAQVEVDEQQVNLDRFTLFFPEKRPFFLENAGLFSVNADGTAQTGSDVELFFSRRIGIGPEGQTVPIIGGARVSGTLGQNTSVGFLNMQTDGVEGVTESNNFTVARVEQKLKNRSSIGAIFVNRSGSNDLTALSRPGFDNSYNRLLGVDGQLGIGLNSEINAYFARTFSPFVDQDIDGGKEYAFDVQAQRNTEAFLLSLQYSEVRGNFNPEVGFLSRSSFQKLSGLIFHRYRPEDFLGFLELRPHVSYRGYWDTERSDNFQETGYLHIDNHWEWRSGLEIHTGVNFRREGVRDAFDLNGVTVPGGTYDWAEAQLVFFTNRSKWISINLRSNIGGFFGGDRISSSGTLRVRYGDKLNSEFTLQRNDITLPGGDASNNLFRTRISYSFTPRIFLQSLLQYNDQLDIWSMNARFGWLQSANTGLFIVFNQISYLDLTNNDHLFYGFGDLSNRSVTVKYTYLFDVFK